MAWTSATPRARDAIAAEISYYRAHFDEGRDPVSLADLRGRCAEALRSGLPAGGRLPGVSTEELTEALLAALQFSAFDDALAALERARGRWERVIVVSNWDVSLVEVLARVGLAPLLDAVVTSASVGVRKPGVAIFERRALARGGAPGRRSPCRRQRPGRRGGRPSRRDRAVLIRRDGGPGPPGVRTIASLATL